MGTYISSIGSQSFKIRLELYTTGFPKTSACRQQMVGFSLRNCLSQFLIITLFLRICIFTIGPVSPENPDTDPLRKGDLNNCGVTAGAWLWLQCALLFLSVALMWT